MGIMFNGRAIRKVVIFKKDSVLSKHTRIQGSEFCVWVSKMFRKTYGYGCK